MCLNKSWANDADMILTPNTRLSRASKGSLWIWQWIEIEDKSKWITSEENSDSSNHSLLIMDTSSFVVLLRKAFSEGSKGSFRVTIS
jgi:hypothetical protein